MAASVFEPPVTLTCTTGLSDLGVVVPSGKVRRYDVRAVNIGSADVFVDVFAVDPASGANSHYRCKNFPLRFQDVSGAVDVDLAFFLPAGWKLQAKASASSSAQVTATMVTGDA